MTLGEELERAVADVHRAIGEVPTPRVGLILGSGLGAFADTFTDRVAIPFAQIHGFPAATIVGHSGNVVYGRVGDLPLLALQGRVHGYEGHELSRVAFPARVLIACGCRTLIVTNAAGGIDTKLKPGEIVVISDHLNLLGGSPLRGPNDDTVGARFPDMTEAYDRTLRQQAIAAGKEIGLSLREGVYAALPGPTYETPAEIRMLRTLGADLCGMSTVPEVIAARHMGAGVLGLSLVTNLAAGISGERLSHAEVTATADRTRDHFEQLLKRILSKLSTGEANA